MTASQAHFLVMGALKGATKPMTLKELEPLCGLPRTTIKKYTRRFNENGRAYIADWVKKNGRVWTPMWLWGGEPNVPKPPNVASDRIRPPRGPRMPPKPRERHEPIEVRTVPLMIPDRPYKTTFIGGNPWLSTPAR